MLAGQMGTANNYTLSGERPQLELEMTQVTQGKWHKTYKYANRERERKRVLGWVNLNLFKLMPEIVSLMDE